MPEQLCMQPIIISCALLRVWVAYCLRYRRRAKRAEGNLLDQRRRMSSIDTTTLLTEPVSHHISDTDTWGPPDRNYYVFIALTFLLGFLGLDHVYLRSYGTAMKKLLTNFLFLGVWYFWDIMQVVKDGAHVRKHGLNSPLDWIRGIGRGTFKEPKAAGTPEYAAPKSYILYTLLAVFAGIFAADKFYLGENIQGLAKLFSVFNIFLFLIGLLWVAWDAFHAVFMTESIMKDGISVPIPFNFFFRKPIPAGDLFRVQEVREGAESSGSMGLLGLLPVLNWKGLYGDIVAPLLRPTVGAAVENVGKMANVAGKAASLATSTIARGPALVSEFANAAVANATAQATQATKAAAGLGPAATAATAQTGGGSSGGPGPVLAGSLTALLLAGGLKGMHDVLSKYLQ